VKNKQGLLGARRLFFCQVVIALLIAVVAAIFSGNRAALSAVLGGLVSAVPNAYFALKFFKHQGARAAKQIVNSFYLGEALKIVISIILFALVFIFFHINPLVFFITYIVVQMMVWFAPLMFTK
jgi:ATP synthase protein I